MAKIKITEILNWYEKNKRTLPWRRVGISSYAVWVSEIMLQQTQVSRGIVFYERFLKKFPTVRKLAKTTWEEFLPYYEGLGYYNRGRNMLKTAKVVVADFGGEFPKDKHQLMKLPGIGEYTASAILSFAHDLPHIAYDTNFKRIFGTRETAERAFKKSGVTSSVFNSAVMDYSSAHKAVHQVYKVHQVHKVRTTSITVVLHENHKKYFSENSEKYEPFIMPSGVSSREHIKKYFLEKYGLRVSVRPPDKKGLVNAQILSGAHHFAIYSKKDYD
ncbi:MAG: hypothetical protein WCT49_00825 [Candidatus Paceibacterota bacterium]|jgi:A/G-specific adenine glycosylase|nr:hypothetical protein [Candidatus Paceibacterota bacterium]